MGGDILEMETCPYQELYIYYMEGLLNSRYEMFGNDFLGNWEDDGFSFLFFSSPADKKVERLLKRNQALKLLDRFNISYEDWQGGPVVPFSVGGLYITPPWIPFEHSEAGERVHILLDPGVVFGTGTHPTTRDCLKALEIIFDMDPSVESMLDLGTGTGILALAAAQLGSKRNLALDMNFLAVKTAYRNIRLNRMEKKVFAVQGAAEDFMDCPADLVIANIHYEVMKSLLDSDAFISKRWFILSGLFRSQARDVAQILERLPITVLNEWEREGIWHTFFGRIDRTLWLHKKHDKEG